LRGCVRTRSRIARLWPWRLAAAAFVFSLAGVAGAQDSQLKRGEYVYRLAGCENCHTDRDNKGARLAGGRALVTPLGTFYAPNITPDPTHGIGRWSDADFVRALRAGVSPGGAHYYPAFPYTAYTLLSDDDLRALKSYLFAQPPVAQPNKTHALPWYLRFRPVLIGWKWLFFREGPYRPDARQNADWNRGAYLARAAAHCSECHTPRNVLGALRGGLYLAGTTDGPEDGVVPNITPDKKTGIGRWRRPDLVQYLDTGMTPDGDFAGGLMAELIDHGLKYLTAADREALVTYVQSVPAVEHAVRKPKKKDGKKKDDYGF
jgi:mono/diheme cytochrome c family protein